MRTTLLCTTMVLFCGMAQAQAPNNPPPIVRVFVEHLKPGKGAPHEKSEAAFVRILNKGNYPAHYLALTAMSGPDEVWYMEEHSSFAEVETSEKAGDAPALKPELDQAAATDGEYLTGSHSLIAVYRPDLSYRAEQAMTTLPKARYFDLITIRIKPGTDQRLAGAVKDRINAYNNVQLDQPVLAYQVISGAPGDTFLILEPFATLAVWDKYPANMRAVREAGGRKYEGTETTLNEIVEFRESRLMSISPKMSYVSREFASADAEFWAPKPATTRPAPKKAARPEGQ